MEMNNDKYHGDEHITDKPQKYLVEASEVVHYQIEVEAMSKDEAYELAFKQPIDENTPITKSEGFQIDNVAEVEDELDYNYRLGDER